tara:strand:+ start:66 stop:488 length:423 start_codon:yes stop_codon:yes gene_type:complete
MVKATSEMEEVDKLIRRKWHQMQWRVNNQKSYIKKGIRILFVDYEDFKDYALSKDIQEGFHCHRPDRMKSYSRDNLEFISADAHRKITAREKRKLNDNDVRCIRDMALFRIPQRKIASQFNVSQATVWKIVNRLAYKDVN